MKKLGIVLGAFFFLVVAAIVIIPMVVDVDKYRPQILTAANQHISGRLELGHLSLSLLGHIQVEIEGVKLSDSSGRLLVGVKGAHFRVPFLSILSGSPELNLEMEQPLVSVVKDAKGDLNLLGLVKPSDAVPAAPQATPATPGSNPAPPAFEKKALPGILVRSRLGVKLVNAVVSYRDELTGLKTQVKDLNFIVRDISLSHPMELEMWADLDTGMGKVFALKGPARLTGKATPTITDGKLDQMSLVSHLEMGGVEISVPGMFQKKAGLPTAVDLVMSVSEQGATIESLIAQFFNVEVKGKGSVVNPPFSAKNSNKSNPPRVSFEISSNEINFKPWVELLPMLQNFELEGKGRLKADVAGPSDQLNYRAEFNFDGIKAKLPKLKSPPVWSGVIHVMTDQVDKILVSMKAPGNDLRIQGKIVSFIKPQIDLTVTSTGMDLDSWIDFPPPAPANAAATTPPGNTPATTGAPKANYDAMLDPLRENPTLKAMSARIAFDLKAVKARQVKMDHIVCKMGFKDLAFDLSGCQLGVFSGVIETNGHFELKPKAPVYRLGAKVSHLDFAQAVESQMPLFKNTLLGSANFSLNAQGSSFNPDTAMANLKADGNLSVNQATFVTVDILKMVSDGINKSLGDLGDKVSALKGKKVGSLGSHSSKYEVVSSDFKIENLKFSAPHFVAKAMPNEGIDLKGSTEIGLKDYALNTSWDVIDTYNLTGAKDLSIEQQGVKVDHILSENNSPVHFPVHAGCTLMAPCFSYTAVPAFLGKIALNNVGNAVSAKAKDELRKHAESVIQNVAPPAVQEQFKNSLKGLFH